MRGGWRAGGRGPARIEVRSRIALITAGAVALAVVLVAVSAYVAVRNDLYGGIDRSLNRTADLLEHERATHDVAIAYETISVPSAAASTSETNPVAQVVGTTGVVVARTRAASALPVLAAVRALAEGRGRALLIDTTATGVPLRLLARPFGSGLALELAVRIGGIDAELGRLAEILLLAAAGGIAIALLLGWGVSGLALRPVRHLTTATEEVAASQDLSRRLPAVGRDELSRLANSVNALLWALERAEVAQRQLVADASHELRTPLASLRMNVELLTGIGAGQSEGLDQLDATTRRQLASDVVRQFDRVGVLVGDLVELARQDRTRVAPPELVEVDLCRLVGEVVELQALQHPKIQFATALAPTVVRGVPGDLERMVANLLDNAAKWSPEGTEVEVTLEAGPPARLSVRDHGAGIARDDLIRVFDRFYRGRNSQAVPGSGLGLAIVRRIVDLHGGTVAIHSAPGTGTAIEVCLPAGGPGRAGREPSNDAELGR